MLNRSQLKALLLYIIILVAFPVVGLLIRLIVMFYHPGYTEDFILFLKNISFALYIVDVCTYLIIGFIFLSFSLKERNQQSRTFFVLLFFSFLLIAISFMIRIYYVFFIPQDANSFYEELFERTELTQSWAIIQVPILFIGLGFWSLNAEYAILQKKTKFILSITIISSSLLIFFLPYNLALIVQIIPMLFLFLAISLLINIYLYIAIENYGMIRKKSLYIAFGLIMVMIFLFMNSQSIMGFFNPTNYKMLESPTIFAPILSILGCLFLFNGYRVREIDTEEKGEIETSSPFIEKLGLDLTKPVDLSQEDVKFYREKTVCLVCKKTLSGFSYTFICPDCKALYCENCARTLSNLENTCWSCDIAIDDSKPVKHYKKVEQKRDPKDSKKSNK